MSRRRISGLLALVIIGILMCAQTTSADERQDKRAKRVKAIVRDLALDDPATVARAAYEAGGLYRSRAELVPALLEALKRDTWEEAEHGTRAVKHLLDALIRLDAEVPMVLLERHEEPIYTGTEVLILAARRGEDAHPLLRRVFERANDGTKIGIAGIAAGNLLAAARDEQFVRQVLPKLHPTVLVNVFQQIPNSSRTIGIGSGTGCGHCTIPEGFPPAVWYVLSFSGRTWQRSLVAEGAVESVWFLRHEESRRKFIGCSTRKMRETTALGLGWVATLLGVQPEDVALKARYYRSHEWSTPDAYKAHIAKVRTEVRDAGRALLDRLIKANLLSAKAKETVVIAPTFEINDRRDDKSVPLPDVEATTER